MQNSLNFIKRFYFPIALFVVVAVGFIAYALFTTQARSLPPLAVTSASPSGQETLNPFSSIVITFNRAPKPNEYALTINPPTNVTIASSTNNTIMIKPTTSFASNTLYQITINTTPPFVLPLLTQQEASNVPGWNDLFTQALQNGKPQNGTQAAALSNIRKNSPVQQAGFTISYSYDTNIYTVTLSAPHDVNKTNFLSWLTRSGITDLSEITLQYINQ